MSERTTADWGAVAVRLPGWRWLPGMRVRWNDSDGVYSRVIAEDEGDGLLDPLSDEHGNSVPDVDDLTTCGALLVLLGAEAWRVRFTGAPAVPWGWWVANGPLEFYGTGGKFGPNELGRAAVAAAEAAGGWSP